MLIRNLLVKFKQQEEQVSNYWQFSSSVAFFNRRRRRIIVDVFGFTEIEILPRPLGTN